MKYLWIPSSLVFIPEHRADEYASSGWALTGYHLVSEDIFNEFSGNPPSGKIKGADENGMPCWSDAPPIPNIELRKAALAVLIATYQDDIEKLNRSWLAAAVNGGVNETAKKDVVLTQITARKTQYANDRAAIIAQYPD